MFAWFVRSVAEGDTHLSTANWSGLGTVRPICDPSRPFYPANAFGVAIRDCYYDDQRCPSCLMVAATTASTRRPLAVVR
ncbi:hypothetical protein [Actinoalloteichus hymeniacidonis]|uniref:Uncharacterized protein n=1 Tax=Actinoalloteichus hymeniacidonis TaxID=340345 RepID=A0AAC9HPK4_9PSEU|nr:hypothetical protein [Actinoalloteichus hymeniacidonis]AOS63041.1 hypothetical protein TL08_11135 [Actinoalloteichus hymeniacidonis]MBB5908924.1 hypothetical protein [Actinoalloteichus hymeniacidonis]